MSTLRSELLPCRYFDLKIISATDVEDIRTHFKTKLYAIATIGNDKDTRGQTATDKNGETNPVWDYTVGFIIPESDIQDPDPGFDLSVELFVDRKRGDKRVGYFSRSIHELFKIGADNMKEGNYTFVTSPLVNDSGVETGSVKFEYFFSKIQTVKKLSLLKKSANVLASFGTSVAVNAAVMPATGFVAPIPVGLLQRMVGLPAVRIFQEQEIVRRKRHDGVILTGEYIAEIIVHKGVEAAHLLI